MSSQMPIIEVKDLEFYYDYRLPTQMHALKTVNLEIDKGEYVVFFGPSGCGKTTLVYLIGGITTEKSGTGSIAVNGQDVLQLSREELAAYRQTGIGFVFQQFNLIPSLTVLDNVALPMTFIGVPQDERRARARELLARLKMDEYVDRYPSELSGGQQQRAGIARSLANDPPIVICDEPLGNLDSESAEDVLGFLKELQKKDGRTVIMVTHEAWSVRDADKIVYLKDGTIVKIDNSKAPILQKNPQALALSPNMFHELYPDLKPDEIIVKTLAHLLLRGFSSDEIERFEGFLSDRFANKIDAETFEAFLDRPFRSGGVGLWRQRAASIAALAEDIHAERKKIEDVYHELEKHPETPLGHEILSLRTWAARDYHGQLDDIQLHRLDAAIIGRFRNSLSTEEFHEALYQSLQKGGVGLSMRAMQHISDNIESVLKIGKEKEGDVKFVTEDSKKNV